MILKENILYHMHHVKLILLVWLLAWLEGCVDVTLCITCYNIALGVFI